jgi:hypothetical protein
MENEIDKLSQLFEKIVKIPEIDDENVIKIQKIIRGYLLRKRILIPSSLYQTKNWRKARKWYKDGKRNECEIYQRDLIERITKCKCNKTNERFNMEDMKLHTKSNPMKFENGFEWTEDFDGLIEYKDKKFYFNLKIICESGGTQTRSLREVYMFVKCQIQNIILHNSKNIYINILDGNECYLSQNKFSYLLNKSKIESQIFVGDMKQFQEWWIKNYK